MAGSRRRVFIIVKAPNGDVREVPIAGSSVVIGRDESADIRVEDKKVSRRHAAFKLVEGEPWVEDLGSANGVKLNGRRIDKRARFTAQDKIKVGGYQVTLKAFDESTASEAFEEVKFGGSMRGEVDRPISREEVTPNRTRSAAASRGRPKKGPSLPDDGRSPVLEGLDAPVKGQRFVLHPGENIIGRLEECDVPILDGSVSRQHARVVFAPDRVSVADLGSSNGTFVNDERVEAAELRHQDGLRIGNVRFRLELPPELAPLNANPPALTRAKHREATMTGRSWAVAGIGVLVVAVAALSAMLLWRFQGRLRGHDAAIAAAVDDGGEGALARAEELDAGSAAEPGVEPGGKAPEAVPDAAPEPAGHEDPRPVERTLEPVEPVERTVEPVERTVERVDPGEADAGADELAPEVAAGDETATTSEPAPSGQRPSVTTAIPTSTTPYGRRGPDGMPIDLPEVDGSFDFDAFVAEKLASAQSMEKEGDYVRLREVVGDLLARDPINTEAKDMWKRLVLHEGARGAFEKAERLLAKGELARALKAYSTVPDGAPQSILARAKIDELKTRAITEELDRADKESKAKPTWKRAHRRYRDVLSLDPASIPALTGIRTLERKMREKKVKFTVYVAGAGKAEPVREVPEEVDRAIGKLYAGDEALAKIASFYAEGALPKALKRAEAVEKQADGARKESAKQMKAALRTIQSLHERIRNETSNDPNEAWAKLIDLERAEATILPTDVKSSVRKELEAIVAEAFADSGASLFEREKEEEAFQRWEAGFKLDPANPKVLAGLKKLEERAKQYLDTAELASQRGERGACDQWKRITRITRGGSELHKTAIERVRQVCS